MAINKLAAPVTPMGVKEKINELVTATNNIALPNLLYDVDGSSSTTDGTWLGTNSAITKLTDMLAVKYKIAVAGASTTTFNLNGLGAKTVYMRGTTKVTTHYAVGTVVTMVYNATTDAWYTADYDANSYAYARQYGNVTTNANYPVLFSYSSTLPSTYKVNYTSSNANLTFNPSTKVFNAYSITENGTALSNKYQAKGSYASTSVATTSANGLMSSTDKSKLDGIASGANKYSLPTASSSTLGGIKTGYTTSGKNYKVQVDESGNAYVNVPWEGASLSISTLQDLVGTSPIGDEFTPIYYNGTSFVAQPQSYDFSTTSWSDINRLAERGIAQQYFNIGDKKDITLSTGETITVIIIGFNVDLREDDGSYANITLGMENLLATKYELGDNSWETSTLRTSVLPTIFSQLPTEIQNIIKTVTKITPMYTSDSTTEVTADNLWLFSEEEVSSFSDYMYYNYKYLGSSSDKTTKKHPGDSSGSEWWLRDAIEQTTDSYPFYWKYVSKYGYIQDDTEDHYYAHSLGVCFGFCI